MPETVDFRNGIGVITKLTLNLADQIPTPIILIDGRAGAGKSTFAKKLREELFRNSDAAPTLIHMADLYPGWDGLRAGSSYLNQVILEPLAAGQLSHWQMWDWGKGERGSAREPGNGWRAFSGGNVLLVEGCGSLSRRSRDMAHLSVWIESERAVRQERWQERDAGRFDEFWGFWQAQEDEFYELERSRDLADWVVEN